MKLILKKFTIISLHILGYEKTSKKSHPSFEHGNSDRVHNY